MPLTGFEPVASPLPRECATPAPQRLTLSSTFCALRECFPLKKDTQSFFRQGPCATKAYFVFNLSRPPGVLSSQKRYSIFFSAGSLRHKGLLCLQPFAPSGSAFLSKKILNLFFAKAYATRAGYKKCRL